MEHVPCRTCVYASYRWERASNSIRVRCESPVRAKELPVPLKRCKDRSLNSLMRLRKMLVTIGIVMAASLILEAAMDSGHKFVSYQQNTVYAESNQPPQDATAGQTHF